MGIEAANLSPGIEPLTRSRNPSQFLADLHRAGNPPEAGARAPYRRLSRHRRGQLDLWLGPGRVHRVPEPQWKA